MGPNCHDIWDKKTLIPFISKYLSEDHFMRGEENKYMMNKILLIFFAAGLLLTLAALSGCRSVKYVTCDSQDSTRVEVRTQTIFVPDTVFFEIPVQTAERITRDSTSHLENDYAVSDVRINVDGTFYHDLRTKPQIKPIPTEKEVERIDSIVYKDKFINNTITKEVTRKLSWFQKAQIYGFWCALFLLCILLKKRITEIIKRLI